MNRITTQDYTFKCSGLTIPKGTFVTAPAAAIATDPDVFVDPNKFDGYRYRRLRTDHRAGEKSFIMGMSTVDSLGFGLGVQACPGRFMAANNIKFMIAKLLLSWELSLEKHGQPFHGPRPEIGYNDFSIIVPSEITLKVRKP